MNSTERLLKGWVEGALAKDAGAPDTMDDRNLAAFQRVFPNRTFDDLDVLAESGALGEWIELVRAYDRQHKGARDPSEVGGGWFHPETVEAILGQR